MLTCQSKQTHVPQKYRVSVNCSQVLYYLSIYLFQSSYRAEAMEKIGKLSKASLCSSDQHRGFNTSVPTKSLHKTMST